ncbi:hypothetical protein Pint_13389 [Pistacia integerrima]|uniref:Uncharacterized protein n=1 Tax=Pistacia integerrima TaxID=434235 RepID=A0ACC0Y996_9ROSI|nr:hypothetical protein Pint_13389 [Pistacia integerrima]
MTTLPEIVDLFSRLTSHLQTLNQNEEEEEEESSINLSISKLNKSLNISQNSRVRVLDAALSLMCFGAPKVFDSVIEFSVKTIISVLSSSITCKVISFRNEEILQIGSSISRHDCEELMEACNDVLEKLKGRGLYCVLFFFFGVLSHLLLRAVVRVAVSACLYRFSFPLMVFLDVKSIDGRTSAVSKLLCYLPREFSLENHEIPLRLLFWYLDPLMLKHDVSKILQDTTERPFLCLKKEFHERVDWHAIVICLALSPVIFIETRALLHNWFLLTGLASILELLIGLTSVILDIISCPSWWGLSLEFGSKLPFSSAYFPYKNHLLRMLAGPLTSESFLRLVHATSKPVLHVTKIDPTINLSATKVGTIDHKSIWALAISFPDWFYFASILLFSERFQGNFHLKGSLGKPKIGQMQDVEAVSVAAARYIAWILNPIDKSKQELLVEILTKISGAWTPNQFSSGENHKEEAGYSKKIKKPKLNDSKEDYTVEKEYDCQSIGLWLKEFQSLYVQYSMVSVNNPSSHEVKGSNGLNLKQNVLFRRIPLGILVGFPSCINEDGCELLLHYAATGRIIHLGETSGVGLKHGKGIAHELEDSVLFPAKFNKREAIAGAFLVFSLTDIIESMSTSLYETDERGVDFICQVKIKAAKYLINCIKRQIQLHIDEDGVQTLIDLSSRLMRWRHQGQVVVQVDKDLDEVINALSNKYRQFEIP